MRKGQFKKGHKINLGRKWNLIQREKMKLRIPWNRGKKLSKKDKLKCIKNFGDWAKKDILDPNILKNRFKKGNQSSGKFKKGEISGEKHPCWKGGIRKAGGYIYIYSPKHPTVKKNNQKGNRPYVAEHRLVMEKSLKRYLKSSEQVHHINGIKDDNRRKNLTIVVFANHFGEITCPFCTKHFLLK